MPTAARISVSVSKLTDAWVHCVPYSHVLLCTTPSLNPQEQTFIVVFMYLTYVPISRSILDSVLSTKKLQQNYIIKQLNCSLNSFSRATYFITDCETQHNYSEIFWQQNHLVRWIYLLIVYVI